MFDLPGNILSNTLGELLADVFGQSPKEWAEQRAIQRKIAQAVDRAEQQFAASYAAVDPELTELLVRQTRFADLPSVRTALHELLTRPLHDPASGVAVLRRSFTDVLPSRVERERVDAAVRTFLSLLTQEVLYITELRERYALRFAQINAEHSRATAEQSAATARTVAAMASSLDALQESLRLLAVAPEPRLLAAPRPAPPERQRPWHNLPQRTYAEFIGRQVEAEQLTRLMLPHPRSRHFVVTIDGIGGVGKSALALELAYRYREQYGGLPEGERFEAIVWVSAKRTLLTAGGIQQRRQSFNTLDDLFREVATVLEQPAILQAPLAERRGLVERALSAQRCLLLVDNLETVDDEELLSFLRELPDPTKALITTRHRIDIAYAIRLTGMPREDALRLMQVEAEAKGVTFTAVEMDDLERRTGGVPLAIEWSIGLMSLGHSIESVLRRLGQGQSDIARFCFAESMAHIRGRDAHRLLLALALFERSVNRVMLGEVAGLGDDPIGRDEGLAELLRLSLVNQKGDRFSLLPLTHAFAREELEHNVQLEQELRERWAATLVLLAQPSPRVNWRRTDRMLLRQEGHHLVTLATWCQQSSRLDLLLAIMPQLTSYYDIEGQWSELLAIAETALDYARATSDFHSVAFIEMNIRARLFARRDRESQAEAAIAGALDIISELPEPEWRGYVLLNYAKLLRQQGKFADALTACRQAAEFAAQSAPTPLNHLQADIDFARGEIARDQGDWKAARTYFTAYREQLAGDVPDVEARLESGWGALANLAWVAQKTGQLDEASRLYQQALKFSADRASKGYVTSLLVRIAALELQRRNHKVADEHAREALYWSQKLGMMREQQQAAELITELASICAQEEESDA